MSLLLIMGDDLEAGLASYLLAQVDSNIVKAATLTDARRLLSARSWSAVILDISLPDGSGFDLLYTLEETSVGVLVLSASKAPLDKVRALDAGADDYIVRPYEPSEFLARVRALLRRSHRQRSGGGEVLRVGGVALDTNALEVYLPSNRRQRLTPNEMRLLHHLMTHAGRVVDKQELSDRLFGAGYPKESSNAVGVYVRRVRCKIEADPDHPLYIVTVHGKGYKFEGVDEKKSTGDHPPQIAQHESPDYSSLPATGGKMGAPPEELPASLPRAILC